jgi:hypothetical protein
VHLASSHRQLRAQDFGEGAPAHFRLFALVSSARDLGSGRTEARLLSFHLGYWQRVLALLLPDARPTLHYTVFDDPTVRERVDDTVRPALDSALPGTAVVRLVEDVEREHGRGYYVGAALRLTAQDGDGSVELGDGGFTTWTAQLLGNAKERCLISCIATERLAALASP